MRAVAVSAVCLAAVLVAPVAARADRTDAARVQYQRGVNAQKQGKFKEAAIAYEAAYLMAPDTALLWNAAHAHRLAGNKRRALLLFRSYARQSTDNRNEAQPFINALKTAIETEVRQRAAMAANAPQPASTPAPTASAPQPTPPPSVATVAAAAPAEPTAPAPAEPAVTPLPPSYVPVAGAPAAAEATSAPSLALSPTAAASATSPTTDPVVVASLPVTTTRKRTPRWVWGILGFVAGAAAVSAACAVALQPPSYPSPAIGSVVLR